MRIVKEGLSALDEALGLKGLSKEELKEKLSAEDHMKDIRQISRDHSLVEELVRFGAITREEAKTHPKRNVITRALGTEERTDSDYFSFRLRAGEFLLLCSDGLSNTVSDEEMLESATSLAVKAWSRAKPSDDPRKTRQRIISSLVRKGFDWDLARQASDTAESETIF